MNPDAIREWVRSIWLTTPEIELLACIALSLAEILESLSQPNSPAQKRT